MVSGLIIGLWILRQLLGHSTYFAQKIFVLKKLQSMCFSPFCTILALKYDVLISDQKSVHDEAHLKRLSEGSILAKRV